MSISVIGLGPLGAVHAACMADLGHQVVAIDTSMPERAQDLAAGRTPFYEPGLEELLAKVMPTGRLRFATDYAAAADADVHFVCVGTPQKHGEYAADLTWVDATIDGLAPHLARETLVVGKSTVPVGTAARLSRRLRQLAPAGTGVHLVWNPEFLREGYAVQDTIAPDRIVYGVSEAHAWEQPGAAAAADVARLDEVYAAPLASGIPRLVTDYQTAELVKAAANSFLATKISFINAMSEVCEAADADVIALADAIGIDDRIGRKFLRAGIGFGGGCLPKDIRAFMARAGELGADQALTFLKEVDAINMRRRARMVDLAREECGGSFVGKRIAALGAAFKPYSDDIRDSPALYIARGIQQGGATVTVTDPKALTNAAKTFPELTYTDTIDEACAGADVVLHLTGWPQYRDIDPAHLGQLVHHKVIIDGFNNLDPHRWRAAGWTFRALGRPHL
ncbi:MAG TPA: UDP-glucose/GDP-mannose dehydrogenase family protein [Segeticoccus sp.]|uniref:UDP-glucose dehydrogenase family protein n=1 Tax=Segeticoccus sp. TaxID=2706531 RepID=UPI002D7FB3AD|nr:UDP-glucose/GDP-mannose dehydrogenase family protein [Segeticoccus sp.]HET8599659.1 UDP-glucose/GDP-mannose dehydrogenase family protein [Segeticoccus sp.]